MNIVIFLIFVLIFESTYCYVMKGHDHKKLVSTNLAIEPDNLSKKMTKQSNLFQWCVRIANDFTFLFSKIIGYIPSHFIRMLIYRYVLHIDIAPKVVIYFGLEVRSPWNLIIGEGTIIGDKAVLDARYGITIGKNVNLSTEVYIWTLQHNVNSHDFGTEDKRGGVTICDRVWLSSRSTVLPGCIVSEGCVLAASAVMTKSCDTSFSILGGVPAKKISSRNNDIDYIFNGAHRYFL